jgi:sugar lactone lactonase YvrE
MVAIKKITNSGIVTTLAGQNNAVLSAQFNFPIGVAIKSSDQDMQIYVTDYNYNRIIKFYPNTPPGNGSFISEIIPSAQGFVDGATAGTFLYPQGIAKDVDGNLYVTDSNNGSNTGVGIKKITPSGVATNYFGYYTSVQYPNNFYEGYNTGLTIEADGRVFVCNAGKRILKITPPSTVSTLAGSIVAGMADGTGISAQFSAPQDICKDVSGNFYVTDMGNHRIRKITPTGIVTTFAGSTQGYADGTGTSAQFNNPTGIIIDASGNLFVADAGNYRIRKITQAGIVTTFAGSTQGYADGVGTVAKFKNPNKITIDNLGNLYIIDTGNYRIRKISPMGLVTTFAGSGINGSLDGPINNAKFSNGMSGIVHDQQGSLYITERYSGNSEQFLGIKRISNGYSIYPDLPAGLSFDSVAGVISGTPTVATAATTYTISAYNEYGTATTTVVISIGALGVDSFEKEKLKLYPNPTHSLINIQMFNNVVLEKVTIVDITGKVVLVQTENLSSINVEKLSKGVYILTAYLGDKKHQEKFIKN